MDAHLVVHYGEIGTKGNNRNVFESCLAKNIVSTLHPIPLLGMRKLNQRFLMRVAENDREAAMERLEETFGISWCAAVESVGLSYEEIRDSVISLVEKEGLDSSSFRITAKRANKEFPIASTELATRLGADVVEKLNRRVELTNPGINVNVDVLSDRAILYTRKVRGPGGLPVGVSGRVVHLLSGGIDSPVAAWFMMKRGCRVLYLHFFAAPDSSAVLDSKVLRIVKRLSRYGGRAVTILLPFSEYQVATSDFPQEYEPVIFRAFMRRIAEVMAPRFGALAISTGDNLGQVASQTLHNLRTIDQGASLPTLRPLLAFNKTEIIDAAKSIGTYELSIEEYQDCCALLSRHPKTRANPDLVDLFVRKLKIEELMPKIVLNGTVAIYEPSTDSIATKPLPKYFKSMVMPAAEQT